MNVEINLQVSSSLTLSVIPLGLSCLHIIYTLDVFVSIYRRKFLVLIATLYLCPRGEFSVISFFGRTSNTRIAIVALFTRRILVKRRDIRKGQDRMVGVFFTLCHKFVTLL